MQDLSAPQLISAIEQAFADVVFPGEDKLPAYLIADLMGDQVIAVVSYLWWTVNQHQSDAYFIEEALLNYWPGREDDCLQKKCVTTY